MRTKRNPDVVEALVRAAANGDREAFDRLVEHHFAFVYSISYAHLKSREAAEDLTQEVFLRAYLFLHQLRDPSRFPAWLGRMARNFALQWLRTGQRTSRLAALIPLGEEIEAMADSRSTDTLTQMVRDEEQQSVRQAIADLPGDLREIILLRHLGELSLSEIAIHQEVHVSTVSRKHDQALKRLRGALKPMIRESVKSLAPSRQATVRTLGTLAAVAALPSTAKASVVAQAVQTGGAAASASTGASGIPVALLSFLKSTLIVTKTGGTIAMSFKTATIGVAAIACITGGIYCTQQGGSSSGTGSPVSSQSVAASPAAQVGSAAGLDTSSIADAKTRAVVEEILRRLANIREYTATVRSTGADPRGRPLSMTEQLWYKKPYVLDVQTNTEHPTPVVRGNTSYLYSDGNTLVTHVKPGPSALQAFTASFEKRGMSRQEAERMAAEKASATYRTDLQRLRAAGVNTSDLFFTDWVANPFASCDLSTIRLEGENADEWVLSGIYSFGMGRQKGVMHVGKDNHIVRSVEFDASSRGAAQEVTVEEVRINPSPAIDDAVVKYVAPAGVTITDQTDDFIRRQRERPPQGD